MQVGDLKQIDGADNYKQQLGFELASLGQTPQTPSRKDRQQVALLQTKRKVSTLESMSQNQKRQQTTNSNINQLRQSLQSFSFQQSELSDDQFYDANSQLEVHGVNYSNSGSFGDTYDKQKSKQEFCDIDSEKDNELYESQMDQSEGSNNSFYSIDDGNSPDLQYERTKMSFFNHVNINPKSKTSPAVQKSSIPSQLTNVYLQRILGDDINQNNERASRQIKVHSNELEDNVKQQRNPTSDSQANDQKSEISQAMISQSNISQLQIIEESDSDAGSSTQSRKVSTLILNETQRTDSDIKQYTNLANYRSSCINQFTNKNMQLNTIYFNKKFLTRNYFNQSN